MKHECHSLKSEQNGTQLQTSRHVHCVVSNGSRSEIEYEKTAGGRVPNAAMVHRDTFITPTLPLASERVSARSPPASTWECSDSAPIFLNISFLYSSWECSILRLSFTTYHFSILRARPTFLTQPMPFSFSVHVPFLSQSILSIFIVTYFTTKKVFSPWKYPNPAQPRS